ncbi:hypothetical protein CH370_05890 [Leptospira kmetyi]|nr:hypothetical protein CH370_05890 [Leptospira kmetyi]
MNAGTLSFREKKKSIERKIRILEESRKAIPFQKQEENWNRISTLRDRFQNFARSGTAQEREESLLLLERAVPQVTADFAEEGKVSAKNLIVLYSEGYLQKKNHPEETPLSASAEEKASNYFRMAKEELNQAEKFDRDRNDFYALVLYGRSIQYSLNALDALSLEIPSAYSGILKKKKRS